MLDDESSPSQVVSSPLFRLSLEILSSLVSSLNLDKRKPVYFLKLGERQPNVIRSVRKRLAENDRI